MLALYIQATQRFWSVFFIWPLKNSYKTLCNIFWIFQDKDLDLFWGFWSRKFSCSETFWVKFSAVLWTDFWRQKIANQICKEKGQSIAPRWLMATLMTNLSDSESIIAYPELERIPRELNSCTGLSQESQQIPWSTIEVLLELLQAWCCDFFPGDLDHLSYAYCHSQRFLTVINLWIKIILQTNKSKNGYSVYPSVVYDLL